MDAGSRGSVLQRPGNSRIVLSQRTLCLFCLGVLGCELRLTLAELALSRSRERYLLRRGCVRNLVEGHMIGTGIAVEIILITCPLAGGSVMLLCLLYMLWVSIWVGWVVEGVVWGSCCVRCAPK